MPCWVEVVYDKQQPSSEAVGYLLLISQNVPVLCSLGPPLLFKIKVFLAQLHGEMRPLKSFSPSLELTDQFQLSLAEVEVARVLV